MKCGREVWQQMTTESEQSPVRNFTTLIDMSDYLVETDLFPVEVLEAYTTWNLEKTLNESQRAFFNAERGGGQGDYREGMANKIDNVVDCLNRYPESKRAVITVPNNSFANHEDDDLAKCMRELHFYLEDGQLHGSVFFRAQAASIFPKNIHFIGGIMNEVSSRLHAKPKVGHLHYLTTILVGDRW